MKQDYLNTLKIRVEKFLLTQTSSFLFIYLRIVLCLTYIFESYRLFNLKDEYQQFEFFFKFQLFHWLPIMPSEWFEIVPYILALISIIGFFGFFVNIVLVIQLIIYGYYLVIEATFYNNHFYLIWLVNLLLLALSVRDFKWYSCFTTKQPLNIPTIPRYYYLSLQLLIVLVYFSGAIVKLNPDWMSGQTILTAFQKSTAYHQERNLIDNQIFAIMYSWIGIVFDFFIGFLFWSKKFRKMAFLLSTTFHLINAFTLDIGVFPWFMILFSLVFINPIQFDNFLFKSKVKNYLNSKSKSIAQLYFLVFFFFIQLILPLRHHLIVGYVDWTGEGSLFAWRMKSSTRELKNLEIYLWDKNTKEELKPNVFLSKAQVKLLYRCPLFFLQFRDNLLKRTNLEKHNTIMKVKLLISINGHPPNYLIDTSANLCNYEVKFLSHNDFVTKKHD